MTNEEEPTSGEVKDLDAVTPPPQMHEYPRPQPQKVAATDDPLRFVIPLNPSIWAIAAGYLGLFSVLFVCAPFSLIAGLLALKDIKQNPGKTGKGRAWFGIVMGVVFSTGLGWFVIASLMQRK